MTPFIHIVYIFLIACGSVFAVGERTITLGGDTSWRSAENRAGISEVRNIRPNPVLVLSSRTGVSVSGYSAATGVLGNFSPLTESTLDLSVSFDERETRLFRDSVGHYRLMVPPYIEAVDRRQARAGAGAVLFGRSGIETNSNPVVIQPQNSNALFAPGNSIRDFSVEFWLYPQNLENGEQMLSWVASGMQRITAAASRNRLQWSFVNFFASPNGAAHINIEFSGNTPVIPKTWSHHLIRFDASTGMLEYLVDGSTEAIVYATATGRESTEVYTPVTGNGGTFLLGERFTGLIDEFKIHKACIGRTSTQRYYPDGGRVETRAVDLGETSSGIVRIDVLGGRTSVRGGAAVQNEFRENGRFRFSDDSEMNFFIRAGENPFLLNNNQWVSFTPGAAISGIQGRYVQIAVDFYPSADGETSPYLDQLRIVYIPGGAPLPPRNLTASASDGAVSLRWRNSPAPNVAGYLVYYSTVRGELFGTDAALGASPIDVGITNSVFIDGLRNGTLYYFRVAAYNLVTGELLYNIGEFSAEVTARPLTGLVP